MTEIKISIERAIKRLLFIKEYELQLADKLSFAAINMAIQALEKQVPKKPVIKEWSPARCPTCGAELSEDMGDGYYKHWYSKKVCDCGQKLDWNEVES
jgi:hypothetical protein